MAAPKITGEQLRSAAFTLQGAGPGGGWDAPVLASEVRAALGASPGPFRAALADAEYQGYVQVTQGHGGRHSTPTWVLPVAEDERLREQRHRMEDKAITQELLQLLARRGYPASKARYFVEVACGIEDRRLVRALVQGAHDLSEV